MIARLVLLFILLALRFYDLGVRPPHHDEAVNGWFVDGMFKKGFYQYDPQNYHGPLFFYILALFEKIFGRSIEVLRSSIVLFSWAVTFTPFLFRKWLGERATWIATFFLALSPAMIFYSRYTIHEMEFVLASIVFFYYWLNIRNDGFTRRNNIGLGLSLGAMACLKENFVLYLVCLFIAEVMARAYERYFPNQVPTTAKGVRIEKPLAQNSNSALLKGVATISGIAFALIAIFYSGFFQDPNGIANFFRAFYFWSQTGSDGHGHQKPFIYWIKLMFEMEWFALLGLALTVLALKKVKREVRLLSIVSVGLWLVYSLVAYKTPWCVMSFYWGLILIAAYWVGQWMEKKGWRAWIMIGLIAGFSFSGYEGYLSAYENVDEDNQFYIYGQTYRDLMIPLNEIVDMGKADPSLHEKLRIQIISQFTWPLPFVLGEFKSVGYFSEANAPEKLDGDVILMDQTFEAKMASRLVGNYSRAMYRSRQWAAPMIFFRKQAQNPPSK